MRHHNIARRNSFIGQANSLSCNFPMLDVDTKNGLLKVYCSIMVPNFKILQIIISRRTALHERKAYEDYGRFHTIRAN